MLKKVILIFIAVFIILLSLTAAPQVTTANLQLYYDGEFHDYSGLAYEIRVVGEKADTDVPGLFIDDILYIPLRAVIEKLGGKVIWDPSTSTIVSSLNKINIEVKGSGLVAKVNGETVILDVPVMTINSRTMVPAQFLMESLNMLVSEDRANSILRLDKSFMGTPHVTQAGSRTEITIPVSSCDTYVYFRLVSPDRIVVDIPNVVAPENQKTVNVALGILKTVRYAQYLDLASDYIAARIVLDVEGVPDFGILNTNEGLVISLANPEGYVAGRGEDADRQDTYNPVATAGIGTGAGAGTTTSIITAGSSTGTAGGTPAATATASITGTAAGAAAGTAGSPVRTEETTGSGSGLPLFITQLLIDYSINVNADKASVNLPRYDGYEAFMEGNNLILSFPNVNAPLQEYIIEVGGNQLKRIKFFQFDENRSRIVFELGLPIYVISELAGKIDLSFPSKNEAVFGKLVVLDPGHGGNDSGAYYFNTREKDLNLDIALRLEKLLLSYGINVSMTRRDDRAVDLYERPEIANRLNADLFVSIHNNALNSVARGTETYYYTAQTAVSNASKGYRRSVIQKKIVETSLSFAPAGSGMI